MYKLPRFDVSSFILEIPDNLKNHEIYDYVIFSSNFKTSLSKPALTDLTKEQTCLEL